MGFCVQIGGAQRKPLSQSSLIYATDFCCVQGMKYYAMPQNVHLNLKDVWRTKRSIKFAPAIAWTNMIASNWKYEGTHIDGN